jgi:hypothetical protein
MAAIARLLSQAFPAGDEKSDAVLPVLMFTIVGLLLSISLFLANGAPWSVGFETF